MAAAAPCSGGFAVLRAPSLVAGTLAIYAMVRLGHEAVGWRTGLVAGVLLAVSPGAAVAVVVATLCAAAAWFSASRSVGFSVPLRLRASVGRCGG